MESEFSWHRKNGRDELRMIGLDLYDIVTEISYLIHKIYCVLARKSPVMAQAFKDMVIQRVIDPDSITWDTQIGSKKTPDLEVFFTVPNTDAK